MSMYTLRCLIDGDKVSFKVKIPIKSDIDDLKHEIKKTVAPIFEKFAAKDLILWKIDVDARDQEIKERINAGQYRPALPTEPLDSMEAISVIWPGPPDNRLQVFICLPSPGKVGSSTLVYEGGVRSPSSVPLPSPQLYPRSNMISLLYERLKKYGFIMVRGTPGSGKTSLTRLLGQHIRDQEPSMKVVGVFSWPREEVAMAGGWESYLRTLGWPGWECKTVFIFDEAQVSYGDSALWGEFFKNLTDYPGIFVITFASYGSPMSQVAFPTPFVVKYSQTVTLRSIDYNDGIDGIGLLLTRKEFDGFVRKQFPPSDYFFHSSFFDGVFELTVGHVGAICDFVDIIIAHDSYRALKNTPGQLYTWDLFLAKFSPVDLFVQLETSASVFKRGLPLDHDLRKVPIARIFSHVLSTGSIVERDLENGNNDDIKAAQDECFRNGWLHADKFINPAHEEEITYVFPSPLHRWFVEWKLFYPFNTTLSGTAAPLNPITTTPFTSNTILELVLKVIARFSPRKLSAERNIGPGCIQRPPEAQYQDEFYRSSQACSNGSLLMLPEFGTKNGRVDFYIPSMQWGVELLRNGDWLEEHSGRFSQSGVHKLTLSLSDYIILDCRNTRPRRKHPNIRNLYHVVFSNEYQEVSILDNLLQPVDGGQMRLLCSV